MVAFDDHAGREIGVTREVDGVLAFRTDTKRIFGFHILLNHEIKFGCRDEAMPRLGILVIRRRGNASSLRLPILAKKG